MPLWAILIILFQRITTSSPFLESQYHQAQQNPLGPQQGGDEAAPKVVVKCATPPQALTPKGWNGEASHNRKCQSFKVENSFYSDVQVQTDASCRTAKCLCPQPTRAKPPFLLWKT